MSLRKYLADCPNKLRWIKQSFLFNLDYANLCRLSADIIKIATYGDRIHLGSRNYIYLSDLPLKTSKTVHLYGSGRTIVDWYHSYAHSKNVQDLHVGFNWSGLIDFPFDLYFFEIYGLEGIHKKGLDVARSCLSRGAQVCLKSLYIHNTSDGIEALKHAMSCGIKCLDTYYCPDFRVNIPLLDSWSRRLYIKALFFSKSRPYIWPDAFSSPLTIIALLRRVGYENFVLHGFDLDDGDYFFRYSTNCIATDLQDSIPNLQEKPLLSGNNHDSKRCPRLNLPLMLDLVNKMGYAKIDFANP